MASTNGIDACATKQYALDLGMHLAAPITTKSAGVFGPAGTVRGLDDLSTNPSAILGIDNIAPLTVATAYAAIANDGQYCAPIVLDRVKTPEGKYIKGQQPDCKEGIASDLAVAVQSALRSAEDGYPSNPHDGTEHIAKTGTTNGANQTWVTTASKGAALTVWFGNIQGEYNIRNYAGYTGGNIRHTIAAAILTQMDELYPGKDFAEPESKYLYGDTRVVGDYTGMSPSEARDKIVADGFTYGGVQGTVASDLPEGQVAKQSYGAGSRVSVGTPIEIYTSDASLAALPDVATQGYTFDQAVAQLNTAGFTNVVSYCVATGPTAPDPTSTDDPTTPVEPPTPDGIVTEMAPTAGTVTEFTHKISLGVTAQTC
jgi:membrane peptidoglycan carboxypeptidase